MFNNKIFRYIDSLSEHAELQETKKRYKPTAIMKEWGKHKNESVAQFSKYSILLFQIGSFFECYFEDAFVLSKVLNIALTKKNKNIPFSPFMSGFWVDSLLDKVNTLVEAGLHVIVVRQGMKGNQVVRRRAEVLMEENQYGIYPSLIRILWIIKYIKSRLGMMGFLVLSTLYIDVICKYYMLEIL